MEIEVWVSCHSEKTDASIWCGVYVESNNGIVNLTDTDMIYLGLAESFWENYREFEDGVAQANVFQENNPTLTYQQALFEVFGHFTLSFKVDNNEIKLDIDSNADELMYSLLENL
jgi:hypothetical protein